MIGRPGMLLRHGDKEPCLSVDYIYMYVHTWWNFPKDRINPPRTNLIYMLRLCSWSLTVEIYIQHKRHGVHLIHRTPNSTVSTVCFGPGILKTQDRLSDQITLTLHKPNLNQHTNTIRYNSLYRNPADMLSEMLTHHPSTRIYRLRGTCVSSLPIFAMCQPALARSASSFAP